MLTFVSILVLPTFAIRICPRLVQGESSVLMISDDFCLFMCSIDKFSDNDLTDSG